MKLITKSILALMLAGVIFASVASASYVQNFGGVTSQSSSGGSTSGVTSQIRYDDSGTGNPGSIIDNVFYQDVLTETLTVNANVPAGVIGDASASMDTQVLKSFKEQLSFAPVNALLSNFVSTSLNGKVAASVTKSTIQGVANAQASMIAQSGATYQLGFTAPANPPVVPTQSLERLGGAALIQARIENSGEGTALAEANGNAGYEASITGIANTPSDYSIGHANGDAKVSGTNVAYGGAIRGIATIRSGTAINSPVANAGQAVVTEAVGLTANRDISFAGDSKVQGSLNGDESAESRIGSTVVDSEATSVMNGVAQALNRHDSAIVDLLEQGRTETYPGQAIADNTLLGRAVVTRDSLGGTQKAIGEGYLTAAQWKLSASTGPITLGQGVVTPQIHYASVEGTTGFTQDGLPAPLGGLGVGAWIQNPFINPMVAQTSSYELAADSTWGLPAGPAIGTNYGDSGFTASELFPGMGTRGSLVAQVDSLVAGSRTVAGTNSITNALATRVDNAVYSMTLVGMVPSSSPTTNDAVGAYNGVGQQKMQNVITDPTLAPLPTVSSSVLDVAPLNGIEWLEGNNLNILPGHYTTPIVPGAAFIFQDAVSRGTGLTYSTSKVTA